MLTIRQKGTAFSIGFSGIRLKISFSSLFNFSFASPLFLQTKGRVNLEATHQVFFRCLAQI
jgi:hypothetical protein